MTLPESQRAYDDCFQAMDAALEDTEGVRVRMDSLDAATFFRMRCHKARSIDRKNNARTYEQGHPMHGCSAYDCLIFLAPRIIDGHAYLYIKKNDKVPGSIEPLSGQARLPLESWRRA